MLETGSLFVFNRWAASQGYHFKQATQPADLERALLCRQNVYLESGYFDARNQGAKPAPDPDDKQSAIFFALWHDQCVGTARLTLFRQGFPTLRLFNTSLPAWADGRQTAEFGRFAVRREFRGNARFVSLGLAGALYQYSIRTGIRWWIGFAPISLMKSFEGFIHDWQILPEQPPGENHLSARESLAGYFAKHGSSAKPFILDLRQLTWFSGLLGLASHSRVHQPI